MTGVVAAKWLARAGSRVATIIGAGHIAEELPACLKEAFDLDEIRIISRRFETARAFAERHGAAFPMRAFETVEDAVKGADIVLAISSATEPVLRFAHLAKGMTVCGLGGGYEISADAFEGADVFVIDELDYALTIGSVKGWVESGLDRELIAQRTTANIGEIATGAKTGRRSPDDVVLAIIQGMACCDVALAHLALQQAGLVEVPDGRQR
jgi:ornithine cyclodeaminase